MVALKPALVYAFDVDGVVICGRPTDGKPWATDLETDTGVSLPALREHFFEVYWRDLVVGRADLIPALDAALNSMGAPIDAQALQDYWFRQDSKVNAPAIAMIKDLRNAGKRVVLATNQDQSRARYLMDDLNLKAHVDAVYASGDLGVAKPDAAFFNHITAVENVTPTDIMLLDDRIKNIDAAAALGWQTHHVTTPLDLPTSY